MKNSGQIGGFKILSESGVASGVRRIEAITGEGVVNKVKEQENLLDELAEILKSNRAGLINKLLSMTEEMKESKKELDEFKKKEMLTATGKMLEDAKEINGAKLVVRAFNNYNINDLRALSDDLKKDQSGLVMVFATENEGKVTFMVSITDDLLDKGYHAGKMIKEIAAAAGGGGGGKADMAQAGAKDPSKIKDAFTVAEELMSKIN